VPGVELGAVIVAEDSPVPDKTVPWPPHERAVQALDAGALDAVFDAEVELLTWMAATLTDAPGSDADTVPGWISDADLRDRCGGEAEQLRRCAARLTRLRARVAAYQSAELAEATDHDAAGEDAWEAAP
jgi:hypothetical protein